MEGPSCGTGHQLALSIGPAGLWGGKDPAEKLSLGSSITPGGHGREEWSNNRDTGFTSPPPIPGSL